MQNLFINSDNRYNWVVSLSRSIELTRSGSIVHGVLLVDMSFSGIEQICKDVELASSDGYLYLIDGDGEIIYHPRQQLIHGSPHVIQPAKCAHHAGLGRGILLPGQ